MEPSGSDSGTTPDVPGSPGQPDFTGAAFLQEMYTERARLRTLFDRSPAFIATLRGPEHVFEMASPAYCQLVGDRPIIGREALPEVEEQGFIAVEEAGADVRFRVTDSGPGIPPEHLDCIFEPFWQSTAET